MDQRFTTVTVQLEVTPGRLRLSSNLATRVFRLSVPVPQPASERETLSCSSLVGPAGGGPVVNLNFLRCFSIIIVWFISYILVRCGSTATSNGVRTGRYTVLHFTFQVSGCTSLPIY